MIILINTYLEVIYLGVIINHRCIFDLYNICIENNYPESEEKSGYNSDDENNNSIGENETSLEEGKYPTVSLSKSSFQDPV